MMVKSVLGWNTCKKSGSNSAATEWPPVAGGCFCVCVCAYQQYRTRTCAYMESFATTLIDEPSSDDANKVGICWLCRSTQLHVTAKSRRCYKSLPNCGWSQSATTHDSSDSLLVTTKYDDVLPRTTKHYSSTTQSYKVLRQYYTVLQRTTPVLLCPTKCYSSTTLRYNALLQYYSVLQRTTPVLLCSTKYYSSTTLYYKVLVQ